MPPSPLPASRPIENAGHSVGKGCTFVVREGWRLSSESGELIERCAGGGQSVLEIGFFPYLLTVPLVP